MDNIYTSSNYSVFSVNVKNPNQPWIEICNRSENNDFIVIEPVYADDPLNIIEPLSIFNNNDKSVVQIKELYGSYIANQIDNCFNNTILKVEVSCLRNASYFKHVPFSTFTALTDLFKKVILSNDRYQDQPIIILNTHCDSKLAPLNGFSEMISEITAAYVNCYNDYPIIFVTFCDTTSLTGYDSITEYKKTKKKKKKKKK